jgi:biopolymer transport protein ExbB
MDIVQHSKQLLVAVGAAPVMWLMVGLSVISVAVIIERALVFVAARADFPRLASALASALGARDLAAARASLSESASLEARVVLAGLVEAERGANAAREAMAGASAVERWRLEQRLGFLGTLGNNAPFVGLFGTVIGVVLAFEELGRAGASAAASAGVMASIAEALVATAIGLFVAIPAVAANNVFQRRIRRTLANAEALSHVLLVHLEGRDASLGGRAAESAEGA